MRWIFYFILSVIIISFIIKSMGQLDFEESIKMSLLLVSTFIFVWSLISMFIIYW